MAAKRRSSMDSNILCMGRAQRESRSRVPLRVFLIGAKEAHPMRICTLPPSRREYLLPSRALTTLATAIDARDAEKKRKTFKETAEIWGAVPSRSRGECAVRRVRKGRASKTPFAPISGTARAGTNHLGNVRFTSQAARRRNERWRAVLRSSHSSIKLSPSRKRAS